MAGEKLEEMGGESVHTVVPLHNWWQLCCEFPQVEQLFTMYNRLGLGVNVRVPNAGLKVRQLLYLCFYSFMMSN